MSKLIDMTGQRFGRLLVISKATPKGRNTRWICQCDCGKEVIATRDKLLKGATKSCGCYIRDVVTSRNKTHGLSKCRLYHVWHSMKDRCNNHNHLHYADYGGRGIRICDEWNNDFSAFYQWAYANGYNEEAKQWQCTLDRINVNGDYCPDNCRWVNMKIQRHNRRDTNGGRK